MQTKKAKAREKMDSWEGGRKGGRDGGREESKVKTSENKATFPNSSAAV